MIYSASYIRDVLPGPYNNIQYPERRYWGSILSPIQPTLFGTIDFSSIGHISDAYHIDRMGSGGHFVAFDINFIGNVSDQNLHFEFSVRDITLNPVEYQARHTRLFDVHSTTIGGFKRIRTKTTDKSLGRDKNNSASYGQNHVPMR